MDVFCEQLVKKKTTAMDWLKRIGIVFAGLILIYCGFFILPAFGSLFSTIGGLLAIAAGYGVWYLITYMNTEYEYILTNGEVDIDKILAQRKRKRLITFKIRDVSEFGLYHPERQSAASYDATVFACSDPKDPNTYYAVIPEHKTLGKCIVIFNPNDSVLENAKQYLRRTAIR